jgi:hypothetical protein
MKDAKGHGSDPRGTHSQGVQQVGNLGSIGQYKAVPVTSLTPSFDIFQGINQQRVVDKLRSAIQGGASMPPLKVTPSGRIIDGHHRFEAFKQEGLKSVRVKIVPEPSQKSLQNVGLA